MDFRVDARGPRLVQLKKAQRQLSLLSAQAQHAAASARREEADALRNAAEQALHRAILQPESGLSRSALFDRLRVLAVARAHALESGHAATDLETDAARCDAEGAGQRQRAAVQYRKQKKIEHWHAHYRRQASRLRELRLHTQQLDEISCRRRPSR